MATIAAARSVIWSTSARSAAFKIGVAAKSSSSAPRSAFRTASPSNLLSSPRMFRCPAELSACVETIMPFHTATAFALMTSMLSVTCHSNAWVFDGTDN